MKIFRFKLTSTQIYLIEIKQENTYRMYADSILRKMWERRTEGTTGLVS